MTRRIYVIAISNPAAASAAMMRHKRVPHRVVTLMPGLHPLLVRLAGFERHTVPALDFDGRKVQGSRAIARFLDQVASDPPLFPAEADPRRAVEEAERWGERVLQPVPRRLFRYLMLTTRRRGSGWAARSCACPLCACSNWCSCQSSASWHGSRARVPLPRGSGALS
jgi:glutathione S-transferase